MILEKFISPGNSDVISDSLPAIKLGDSFGFGQHKGGKAIDVPHLWSNFNGGRRNLVEFNYVFFFRLNCKRKKSQIHPRSGGWRQIEPGGSFGGGFHEGGDTTAADPAR